MTNSDLSVYHPYQVEGLQRVGSTYDGGYVIHMPSLPQIDCLINYGVGYNVSFEKEFHRLTGKPVYAFDPTLKSFKYIKDELAAGQWYIGIRHIAKMLLWSTIIEKKLPSEGITFVEEGLAGTTDGKFKTLAYHIEKYGLQKAHTFLKIDIEGAEYNAFKDDSFYSYLDNAVQMIFEFHYLKERLTELMEIMKRLQKTHTLVHIHANNHGSTFDYKGKTVPEVIEVVFLHNSFVHQPALSSKSYPIADLDQPCNRHHADIPIDFFK